MTVTGEGRVAIVVPCFNEAARLDGSRLLELLDHADVELVCVDDGSTDATRLLLDEIRAKDPERVELVTLPCNGGKAEAVRAGLGHAVRRGAAWVGYYDADLATPPPEMIRLVGRREPAHDAILAARVCLLGRSIERRTVRHLMGRCFATYASGLLGIGIYDTQCGAKLFRVTDALVHAIDQPFRTRWTFDVELLGRLLYAPAGVAPLSADRVVEIPLLEWQDVGGSKLSTRSVLPVAREAMALADDVWGRRRATTVPGDGGAPADVVGPR